MEMEFIEIVEKCVAWVNDGPDRLMNIEYCPDRKVNRIWAYDYVAMAGQMLYGPDEVIDPAGRKEQEEREQLAALKAKYEEEK